MFCFWHFLKNNNIIRSNIKNILFIIIKEVRNQILGLWVSQGSSLTFSLAGQSGQPKSGLAGPQLVWLARDTL